MGDTPANVDLVPVSPEDGLMPDFADADLVIPMGRMLDPLFDGLRSPGRLRVVQTLTAGIDHLEAGKRVVIVGFGSIGAAVADRLRPFGVDITGVARSPRDGVLGMDDLDAVLPAASIIVNLLPLTPRTTGCFDARRLALLPDGALLVNAGRGRTVDTAALVAELASGRLSAALDVTDPEPLPDGHPLWSLPNALVSPHIAGDSPRSTRAVFELAGAQVRRFAAGEPLENVVDRYLLE